MGQQQSRGNLSTRNFSHSKFGKVVFLHPHSSNSIQTMEVQLPCDQTAYKKWKQNLKNKQPYLNNAKYLLIPINHKFTSGGLCSYSGIAKVTYQKLPYILEDEILAVKNKKLTFSEPQLWKLLSALISSKNQFSSIMKDSSSNLGKIHPKNIFLNEKGAIKICNPLSWPNYIDGYRDALLKQPCYLSPQDMQSLELGALNNDANINSQIFSIGMTLLSTGLTENLQDLYDFEKNTFDEQRFQEKLMLWKTTMYYSEILRVVVLCLLETEPSKRITLQQMNQFLRPHISDIEAQRLLKIRNTNKKIDEEVFKLRQEFQILLKQRFQKFSSPRYLQKQLKNYTLLKGNTIKPINANKNTQSFTYQKSSNGQNIVRVKSQTKFTYSNRPLQNIAPIRFVVQQAIQPKIQSVKSVQNLTKLEPISPSILRPKIHQNKQKSNQIAQKLVQQGLVFTDSENHTQITEINNRQSTETVINKLQGLNPQSLSEGKNILQKKTSHLIYAQTLIKCDFETAWIQFLAMIHRPDFYFSELENKVTLANSQIQIPPGKVRLTANKEQGKIKLQNLSQNCKGEILGGVSKYSPEQVQIWFNSSYTFQDKPYPNEEYFVKSLSILKNKLQ